jgi:hypothetical protein
MLIVVVAVLLARQGDRLRTELTLHSDTATMPDETPSREHQLAD